MIIIAWRYICLHHLQSHKHLWCFRIPVLVQVRDIPLPPEPDPLSWLQGERIRPELAHDLSVLATIDVLAQTLSGSHRKHMLDAVQKQFDDLKLPEGMSVHSHGEGKFDAK